MSKKQAKEQDKKKAKEPAKKPGRRKEKTLPAIIDTAPASPIEKATTPDIESFDPSPSELVPYDENLLERSRTQWQFGDWESLAKLERDTLQHHPDRAKLALLAAAGHQQLGNMAAARQFTRLAQDWGCGKKLISQILISGIHNTLGRANIISNNQQTANQHFKNSISATNFCTDIDLSLKARILTQLESLASLISNPASQFNDNNHGTIHSSNQEKINNKPDNKTDKFLYNLLKPKHQTEVVDIGANPIDGDPPYKPMLDAYLCKVTGFEPQQKALDSLLQNKKSNETYLPYCISNGEDSILNICCASGMSSLLEPNKETLEIFKFFKPLSQIKEKLNVKTHKLDNIKEIQHIDFLKIDIQGGELEVFKSGRTALSKAVVIQTEISFVNLYKNQPTFGEIDVELRGMGFIPHCLAALKKWPLGSYTVNKNPRQAVNQLLEADIVYIRDIRKPDKLSEEQIKHLAIIAHYCYNSYDLALTCLNILEARNPLFSGASQVYCDIISKQTT